MVYLSSHVGLLLISRFSILVVVEAKFLDHRKLVCFLLLVVQLYLDGLDLFSPFHVVSWYFWQALFASYLVLKVSPTVDLAGCI